MSYDLHLLRKDAVREDPAAAYEELSEGEEREPTAAEEQRLRRLAADLQAVNSGLDLVESGEGFFLQLGYESGQPLVVDIAGVDAITMSWSYGAEDAGPALVDVERYLPVFERHGYVAYDPQLERLFSPGRDASEAAGVHSYVRGRLEEEYGPELVSRRPWWKRFLGR
jgi:hypothetical protein